jgi:N-glycosyltransferase
MRVLVTVHAIESHIRAIQQAVRTLLWMGHEVRVAAPLKGRELIERTYRLPWVEADGDWTTTPGLGETLARALADGNAAFIRTVIQDYLTGPTSIAKAEAVTRIAKEWHPDAILCDATDIGSTIAASKLQILCVSLDNGWYRQLADYPDAISAGLGRHWRGRTDGHLPDTPVITPCHRDLLYSDLDVTHYRVEHPQHFNARLPAWVAGISPDKPLIFATLGSILPGVPGFDEMTVALFRRIISALNDVDCTAVLSVGRNNVQLLRPDVADHIRLTPRIEQPLFLEGARVAAIITAGGLGTVKEIVTTATPPCVIPMCSEHFLIARSFERRRLGVTVSPISAAEEIKAAVVELVTNPTYQRNCVRWQRKTASLPPLEMVLAKILRSA